MGWPVPRPSPGQRRPRQLRGRGHRRQPGEVAFLHLNYRPAHRTPRTSGGFCRHRRSLSGPAPAGGRSVLFATDRRQQLIDHRLPCRKARPGCPAPMPFRNANLLGIAVAWAEVLGARQCTSAHEQESQYPDCRASFFAAHKPDVAQGTRPGPASGWSPLIALDKGAIVRRGVERAPPAPDLVLLPARGPACGRCTGRLRLEGFAGRPEDPIPYC